MTSCLAGLPCASVVLDEFCPGISLVGKDIGLMPMSARG